MQGLIYNFWMPKKKKGPVSGYFDSLGLTKRYGLALPVPIIALLKKKTTKRLLGWMALDKAFEDQIIRMVPEADPVEETEPLEQKQ